MTDKAAVKWQIMHLTALLRLKHCLQMPYWSWEHVMNKFKRRFSHFLALIPCYNWDSASTNIKNSGLFIRIQDGNKVNSVVRWKFRANLRQFWGCIIDHTENKFWRKKMRIYNTSETCKVYLHKVKEKRLNFPAIREHFGIFGDCLHEVTGHNLQKKFTSVSRKNWRRSHSLERLKSFLLFEK